MFLLTFSSFTSSFPPFLFPSPLISFSFIFPFVRKL